MIYTVDRRLYKTLNGEVTDDASKAAFLFRAEGQTVHDSDVAEHPELRKFCPVLREQSKAAEDKKQAKEAPNKKAKIAPNKGTELKTEEPKQDAAKVSSLIINVLKKEEE